MTQIEQRFYPKDEYMSGDDLDELIMDVVRDKQLKMVESDIDDEMRQKYVDISYAAMFDAISYGEEWYVRRVHQDFADWINGGC